MKQGKNLKLMDTLLALSLNSIRKIPPLRVHFESFMRKIHLFGYLLKLLFEKLEKAGHNKIRSSLGAMVMREDGSGSEFLTFLGELAS